MTHTRVRLRLFGAQGMVLLLVAACSSPTATATPPGSAIAVGSLAPGESTLAGSSGSPAPLDSANPEASGAAGSHGPSGAPTAAPSAGHTSSPTAVPTAPPGPAVTFAVTGLVAQPRVCYTTDPKGCTTWPPVDYPRQIAKVTALDAHGRVATGYNGTVTFTHPFFPPGNGGLANDKLKNGVGYFPVLEPKLTFAAGGEEPWATLCPGNGVALFVRDTVNPAIAGCQVIPGGSIQIVYPDGFFDVAPAGCPTGCFGEPTGTITIDTNLAQLSIQDVTSTTIVLTGLTNANQYFIEPVTTGYFVVEAKDFDLFSSCSQCTTTTQVYRTRNLQVPLTIGSYIVTNTSGLFNGDLLGYTRSVLISDQPVGDPFTDVMVTSQVQTPILGAFLPTCFTNPSLTVSAFCLGSP